MLFSIKNISFTQLDISFSISNVTCVFFQEDFSKNLFI